MESATGTPSTPQREPATTPDVEAFLDSLGKDQPIKAAERARMEVLENEINILKASLEEQQHNHQEVQITRERDWNEERARTQEQVQELKNIIKDIKDEDKDNKGQRNEIWDEDKAALRERELQLEAREQMFRIEQEWALKLNAERDAHIKALQDMAELNGRGQGQGQGRGQGQGQGQETRKMIDGSYDSGLPIGHTAVNVVTELMGCAQLKSELHRGNKNIHTIPRLYSHTLEKSPGLRSTIADRLEGSSLRSAVTEFKNAFKVDNDIDPSTMHWIAILAFRDQCEELRSKLEYAITIASALTHDERVAATLDAREKGRLPPVSDRYNKLSMRHQPGIKEMYDMGPQDEALAIESFGNLLLEYMCYDSQARHKLKIAESRYDAFDATSETDVEIAIGMYEKQYKVCDSYLNHDFKTPKDKIKNLLQNCPSAVRSAYATYVSDHKNGINELDLGYGAFLEVLRTVWTTASDTVTLQKDLNLPTNMQMTWNSGSNKSPSYTSTTQFQIARSRSQSQPSESQPLTQLLESLKDIQLKCKGCGNDFTWTVQQQVVHHREQYDSLPLWGPCCKKKKPCFNFLNTGECSYGDNCQFSHDQDEQLAPGSINKPCKYHQWGTCTKGDKCPFLHPSIDEGPTAEHSRVSKNETIHPGQTPVMESGAIRGFPTRQKHRSSSQSSSSSP